MNTDKKQLLFIGLEFHKKTKSADFVLELLCLKFEITFCYVDVFTKTPYSCFSKVEKKTFDVLVCWQIMPSPSLLSKYFQFKHRVFFPMFDSCPGVKKPDRWYAYRDFQIISFSSTLAKQLNKAGFSVHLIQYFPKPFDIIEWGDSQKIFFWNRRESINIHLIEDLFSKIKIKQIHIHKALDPGCKFIEPRENSSIKYSYSEWYETRDEMKIDILNAAYYIAPRQKEGIGMSFLEAMAMGRCIIAPNNPTMNEYIKHGQTGFLYNLNKPKPFQVKHLIKIQKNTYQYMCEGYKRWECEKLNILKWCTEPPKISKFKLTKAMCIRFFRNPVKLIRSLREDAKSWKDE